MSDLSFVTPVHESCLTQVDGVVAALKRDAETWFADRGYHGRYTVDVVSGVVMGGLVLDDYGMVALRFREGSDA